MTSPWSKIPILSPEDQILYDKMRNLAVLQERIDDLGAGYPEIQTRKRYSVKCGEELQYVDTQEELVNYLTDLLKGNL